MRLQELITFLQETAPLDFQESYDNAGLITGNPDLLIKGVLVCLDSTEAVIDEALAKGCNVIIAHHPIIFRGIKKINGFSYIERVIIKAIKNDIAIYAIHTNLDNVLTNGVNITIANKIGLINTQILAPKVGIRFLGEHIGAGLIGDLPKSMKTLDFLHHLKVEMGLSLIRHTNLCKEEISRVALCGGSGSFLLTNAIQCGADIYISADFKYHEFFDADEKLIIADIGHFESEKYTIDLLYELIINKFTTFAVHFTKTITNPVKYF